MTIAFHRFDNEKRRRPEHHARQAMLTPPYVLEPVRRLLGGIELDPCTEPDNPTGAVRFYCPPQDGCALPWDARTVFCNPPYGEVRWRWVDRCITEAGRGARVILLMPASTDTRTFQKAFASSTTCLFLQGRVKFGVLRENRRQEAASHGSALIGFGVDLTPLDSLGVVAKPLLTQPGLFA
jgi:DNA N-6-adenine-methyltransferase (Dam)